YYVKLMLSEFSLHMPVWFLIPNGFCLTSWIWIFILYNQRIMVISMIGLHYCGANLSLRALLARFSPPDFFKTRDMFSDVFVFGFTIDTCRILAYRFSQLSETTDRPFVFHPAI
ncbi:hypothetical protein, partial [Shewanella glacialipiscicola]|uniref:hypothetical protein n=1 Tax=Shewanella glacialipiscicola TaxID=614069 RepID=UPI001C807726